MKRIVIAAANGFIGQYLCTYFDRHHFEVIGLVRQPAADFGNVRFVQWDGKSPGEWFRYLDGALALINLAGKSVNCRYSDQNKAAIYSSRLESTRILGEAVHKAECPPAVWMNAASATIYAHSTDRLNTEEDGIIGSGFSVDVCQKWEAEFFSFRDSGVRQIALRTAIVLGNGGGVMVPYRNLARFGLGGKAGNGRQQFSWIHVHDLARAIHFMLDAETGISGVVNLSAPNPVRNHHFMAALRKAMHVGFGLPAPVWLLRLGARMIGTETELLLKSRYVLPGKLLQAGFEFQFPTIESCLEDLEGK